MEDCVERLLAALGVACLLTANADAAQPRSAVDRSNSAVAAKVKELKLKSTNVLVVDQVNKRVLYAKKEEQVVPIASITKLMTALVVLEAKLSLDERVVIGREDYDRVKRQPSRLGAGTSMSRGDLLKIMLMASENRAAAALARAYPGGTSAFVAAMNQKALELGMSETRFVDSSGLSDDNVSTARDLAWMVDAAYREPLIREYTTLRSHTVEINKGRKMTFANSNQMVRYAHWDIGLSKTGYLDAAGRCLVMQANIGTTPVIIVLLHSWGKFTRIGDANRIKSWIESNSSRQPAG
jgi:serine-type D-Ala-D-Ala endopeptidase (penicillin-binding protein 7)